MRAQIGGLGPTSRCDRAGCNSPASEPFFCCVCHGGIYAHEAAFRISELGCSVAPGHRLRLEDHLHFSFQSRELGIDVVHLKLQDGGPIGAWFRAALFKQRHRLSGVDCERRRRRNDFGECGYQPLCLLVHDLLVEAYEVFDVSGNKSSGSKLHMFSFVVQQGALANNNRLFDTLR